MSVRELPGWDRLRHGGLLLDTQRLGEVAARTPQPLGSYFEEELRRQAGTFLGGSGQAAAFASFVLQHVCGFSESAGTWLRGSAVPATYARIAVTGGTVKPRQLWIGNGGALLPVFLDEEKKVGIGRGRRATSQVLQWLRAGAERLAVLTNGRQWRLVFAGLDFDAWCEWDADLWFEEGGLSPQVTALRTLLQPQVWTPTGPGLPSPLLAAIHDSRKGQADLSAVLGERVREAVELLVRSHGEVLKEACADVDPADIYRAAVRVVMRAVVVLFAESRDLLPRDNALYHGSYGLTGLIESLERASGRGAHRQTRSWNSWPRVLSLIRLVYQGSHHPDLPVPAYGGELFAPGDPASREGLSRALAVFESACYDRELLPDRDVHRLLDLVTRTRVKVRQGRSSTWLPAPVDFSDLSSEYVGILYEGLLDFELRTAPPGDPVIFLALGNQPALPLSRLEAMDDGAIADLLEKLKEKTTKGEEGAEAAGAEAEADAAEEEDAVAEPDAEPLPDEEDEPGPDEREENEDTADTVEPDDPRHVTRSRAEAWARRAVKVGKLLKKPRGRVTPEMLLAQERDLAAKARQLVIRVILPGEWYLVRWGGTRKGAGTFYTRPGLAVPTVQRTLRPLAYNPPLGPDGQPDLGAPAASWTPKTPAEILDRKVCDSACGSGSFPVAALRFLTDALFASLHHHGRIREDGGRTIVALLTGREGEPERLQEEFLPCRPSDDTFEPRLKAILRRHVVERCIYGVDLDPLAVELCRLSLWIETMDRTLPFSFLDHKVKCGNSLVGAWFDQFQHYPVMAWKNREGGDKGHDHGVHFRKEERTKAIKVFVEDVLKPDLRGFLAGKTLFLEDLQETATTVHSEALATLARLHDLPVHDAAERARIYREELLGSPAYRSLKTALDLWCACWFWPADELADAPLPTTMGAPSEETRAIAERIAAKMRFFHWELEFPDVFRAPGSGFDAQLGNPPWETLQPNSKEFFSNRDPLYRTYGKQEALRYQSTYFEDPTVEGSWLDHTAGFANDSNWMKYAASPFGDPDSARANADRFTVARGTLDSEIHRHWRAARQRGTGYASGDHPFRHRGEGKAYTYKLFLEQAHALLRTGGRLGLIVPSGLYSDHGTAGLRRLFLDHCRWEWLFGFENRDKIFEIDSRFKFNPIVLEKGGTTEAIRTAFMRRALEDWERAEELSTPYTRTQVEQFSPRTLVLVELPSYRHGQVLAKVYGASSPLGTRAADAPLAVLRTQQGDINLTSGVALAWHRNSIQIRAAGIDEYGRLASDEGTVGLPIYQGAMVHQMNPLYGSYSSGRGHRTAWEPASFQAGGAQYWLPASAYVSGTTGRSRLLSRRLVNAANERTIIAAVIPDFPASDTTLVWHLRQNSCVGQLQLAACVNSLVFDWVARARVAGATGATALDLERLHELPVPSRLAQSTRLAEVAATLNLCHPVFSPQWLELRHRVPVKRHRYALTPAERKRLRCELDAIFAVLYSASSDDLRFILAACDLPTSQSGSVSFMRTLDQKGFWRVDKEKDPELRHPVLTLVAFHDLEEKTRTCGGDREAGIEAFLAQNDGEGWMLPETLRLADYDLGHDDRAKEPQPVASRLGPRFYDWQLAQSAEESWRECHLHARNLLGEAGYSRLLAEIEAEKDGTETAPLAPLGRQATIPVQKKLFD